MPRDSTQKGYVELPYTLPQDSTVFVLMAEQDIHIWKSKLDWIVKCGGMALVNVHPDYADFGGKRKEVGKYLVRYYEEFLGYTRDEYNNQYSVLACTTKGDGALLDKESPGEYYLMVGSGLCLAGGRQEP